MPFPDILPDPPDGTPVIEAVTGKTITVSWKKPKRLDPSIGTCNEDIHKQIKYGFKIMEI